MKRNAVFAISALIIASAFLGVVTTEGNPSRGSQILYGAGGRIHGTIYTFNVYDELIEVSWASVTAIQDGKTIEKAYSNDGSYEMYLPSGNFDIIVEVPGCFQETTTVFIGDGDDYALDFVMERNNQPIPEFPIFPIQLIAMLSLMALLLVMRKKLVTAKHHS
jgi:hypothetical protein